MNKAGRKTGKDMMKQTKNHAAVIPSSLLPTGTGVKISQMLLKPVGQGTPDPLESVPRNIFPNNVVSNLVLNDQVVPDQVVSANKKEIESRVEECTNGINPAPITAEAIAAASTVPVPTP